MVNLYWWNEEPNVGDAASQYVTSKILGKNIKWSQPQLCFHREMATFLKSIVKLTKYSFPGIKGYLFPWQKGFFAIGSILDSSSYKTVVWGSGFREENSRYRGGKVLAVRGKKSLEKLPARLRRNVAVGDPALLLPLLYEGTSINEEEIKIVPHFVEYDYFQKTYGDKYYIIDVRTTDVENFINEILGAKYILSTSLHGLIFAHAYGIPALWIKEGYINSSDFKFLDYFSAVGIKEYHGLKAAEVLYSVDTVKTAFLKNRDVLSIDNDVLKDIQRSLTVVLNRYFK